MMRAVLLALLATLGVVAPAAAEIRVFVTNEKSNDVTVIEGLPGVSSARSPSASGRAASRPVPTAGGCTWPAARATRSASSTPAR
jgi:hypothetical protein